jgi:hypothetical protein
MVAQLVAQLVARVAVPVAVDVVRAMQASAVRVRDLVACQHRHTDY